MAAFKRFLVFEGTDYYPSGGWNDFVGSFDDPEAALVVARKTANKSTAVHIIDLVTGRRYDDYVGNFVGFPPQPEEV